MMVLVATGTYPAPVAAQAVNLSAVREIRVIDVNGKPVPLADVTIRDDNGEQALLADDNGLLVLPPLSGSAEQIIFAASAVGMKEHSFTLAELAAAGYRLVLARATDTGGDIIVQGRRISSAYAPTTIGKLEILTDPMARADALLAVANLPGSTNADSSADIQLRGSAASLSRAYFNDVPLYEVVRGSAVDRATRGFSVFNSSIIKDVEVYPSNPPLYLANASGGAVRILPDDAANEASTAYASLAGAGVTRTIPLGNGGQVQVYASMTDLAPMLAVNPTLRDVTDSFRSSAVGASAGFRPDPQTRIGLLTVLDGEVGRYPYLYFSRPSLNRSVRLRSYNVASIERGIGDVRLKVDGAFTEIRGRQDVSGYRTRTDNRYTYLSADAAMPLPSPLAEIRTGMASETFNLRTDSTGGTPIAFQGRQRAGITAAFGYLSLRPLGPAVVAVGLRVPVQGDPGQSASYQASTTFRLGDGQKFIVGVGRYSSLAVPDAPTPERLASAVSEQASIDYKFDRSTLHVSLGLYVKRDVVARLITYIHGLDAQLSTDLSNRVSVSGAFTTVAPRIRDGALSYRADNFLAYLVRLSTRVELNVTTVATASFVTRSGTPYSAIETVRVDAMGSLFPIRSAIPNQRQLGSYQTLDLNLTNIMTWWPGNAKPIGFLSVTNLLDRRNPSRVDIDPVTLAERSLFYQRRALTLGIVFQL